MIIVQSLHSSLPYAKVLLALSSNSPRRFGGHAISHPFLVSWEFSRISPPFYLQTDPGRVSIPFTHATQQVSLPLIYRTRLRRVARAKRPVEWPYLRRATPAKIVEVA